MFHVQWPEHGQAREPCKLQTRNSSHLLPMGLHDLLDYILFHENVGIDMIRAYTVCTGDV